MWDCQGAGCPVPNKLVKFVAYRKDVIRCLNVLKLFVQQYRMGLSTRSMVDKFDSNLHQTHERFRKLQEETLTNINLTKNLCEVRCRNLYRDLASDDSALVDYGPTRLEAQDIIFGCEEKIDSKNSMKSPCSPHSQYSDDQTVEKVRRCSSDDGIHLEDESFLTQDEDQDVQDEINDETEDSKGPIAQNVVEDQEQEIVDQSDIEEHVPFPRNIGIMCDFGYQPGALNY